MLRRRSRTSGCRVSWTSSRACRPGCTARCGAHARDAANCSDSSLSGTSCTGTWKCLYGVEEHDITVLFGYVYGLQSGVSRVLQRRIKLHAVVRAIWRLTRLHMPAGDPRAPGADPGGDHQQGAISIGLYAQAASRYDATTDQQLLRCRTARGVCTCCPGSALPQRLEEAGRSCSVVNMRCTHVSRRAGRVALHLMRPTQRLA